MSPLIIWFLNALSYLFPHELWSTVVWPILQFLLGWI